MSFHPDTQNAGGRKAIVDYMTNHYASLFNAKPVVNSRAPPHAHVDAGKAKKRMGDVGPAQLAEQMEGFRRAKAAREAPSRTPHTELQHDKPETFGMAAQLSKAKAKRAEALPTGHLDNIKHLQRRINSIGTVQTMQMTDRKKNEFDTKAYPALLIQREDAYAQALKKGTKAARKTAVEKGLDTPEVPSDDPEPSTSLKRQLLELIISRQWTEDEDLSALYDRTRQAHKHLPEGVVEDAISFVQYSLDHGADDQTVG